MEINIIEHLYVNFIFILIIIKFSVLLLILIKDIVLYTNIKLPILEKYIEKIEKIEKNFEYILNILVSLLLIFLFNPYYPNNINYIDKETKLFLFVYGIYLFIIYLKKNI